MEAAPAIDYKGLYEASQQRVSALERQKEDLSRKKEDLEQQVLLLKLQMEKLQRLGFGQKRERFEGDPNQILLPFQMPEEEKKELEEQTTEKISYERKKRTSSHSGRQPLPDHLPVEVVEIHPDGDLTDMVCIGSEVTEELEYRPASYFIRRFVRYKYAPKDKEGVLIGSLPTRVIEKGMAGPGLVASILVDKYADHLPLYRQGQRFKRENIPIAASTLEGWARQGLDKLSIVHEHLLKETRAKGYLQADESPIRVQDPTKKGSCHQGYYWVYHCPLDGTVLFDYQPGRSAGAAAHVLKGFKGYLQSDGYSVYEGIGARDGVTHLACWAHARREFHNALSNDRDRAEIALAFIQTLYGVEATAREKGLSAAGRKELRLTKSLPTLNAMVKWMTGELKSGNVLPKSAIGHAMHYSLERWDELSAYLLDGSLEIDNNLVENAIRPLALGRKNYLFAGSHEAAKRAAAIYSFFAMCKKEEVNPFQWLKHVFENIMDTKTSKLHTLYPKHFKQLHKM
jgi:transposase